MATITETSHVGKILDWLESLPTMMPANTHTNMVNLETQIQGIDKELNKFDTHTPYTANLGIMHGFFPSLPIYSDQVHARDKSTPESHNVAQDSTNESHDLEGNQLCLRTWKRLAHLKQTSEENMHAPTLGKRPMAMKEDDEGEQSRKKI